MRRHSMKSALSRSSASSGRIRRDRIPRIVAAVVASAAMLAPLAACGGSGDAGATVSSPTTSASSSASESESSSAESQASGTASASSSSTEESRASSTSTSGEVPATTVLAALAIKGRAPKTGYSRSQFGTAWADVDHNGCDTRNDILSRDLTGRTYRSGTHDCIVATGTLNDPYTGRRIGFVRGEKTSTAVQIDHVVALSNAWQTGAQKLDSLTRERFANDPYNLLAVDGPANEQKSDGDAATWLPSNKSFRCQYVARQIGVKHRYGLWVTRAEHDAMARVLSGCPTQTVPARGGVIGSVSSGSVSSGSSSSTPASRSTATARATPRATSRATSSAKSNASSGSSVYYQNCTAVRAAGKAPLRSTDPGYSRKLDRDGDGIACE
ncbi:MAG: DUF1524 domain-containing protein [Bifidobacterium minimum]|nr:DUF1524 domain-containing protein [Bifidobacterium minimum]